MERVTFLIEDSGEQLSCMLNPERVVLRRSSGLVRQRSLGAELDGATDDLVLRTGGGSTEVELDLLFDLSLAAGDAAAPLEDVRELTGALWRLTELRESGCRAATARLIWGRCWNMRVVVDALAERLEEFSPVGAARRSWLRVRLVRIEEEAPRSLEDVQDELPSVAGDAALGAAADELAASDLGLTGDGNVEVVGVEALQERAALESGLWELALELQREAAGDVVLEEAQPREAELEAGEGVADMDDGGGEGSDGDATAAGGDAVALEGEDAVAADAIDAAATGELGGVGDGDPMSVPRQDAAEPGWGATGQVDDAEQEAARLVGGADVGSDVEFHPGAARARAQGGAQRGEPRVERDEAAVVAAASTATVTEPADRTAGASAATGAATRREQRVGGEDAVHASKSVDIAMALRFAEPRAIASCVLVVIGQAYEEEGRLPPAARVAAALGAPPSPAWAAPGGSAGAMPATSPTPVPASAPLPAAPLPSPAASAVAGSTLGRIADTRVASASASAPVAPSPAAPMPAARVAPVRAAPTPAAPTPAAPTPAERVAPARAAPTPAAPTPAAPTPAERVAPARAAPTPAARVAPTPTAARAAAPTPATPAPTATAPTLGEPKPGTTASPPSVPGAATPSAAVVTLPVEAAPAPAVSSASATPASGAREPTPASAPRSSAVASSPETSSPAPMVASPLAGPPAYAASAPSRPPPNVPLPPAKEPTAIAAKATRAVRSRAGSAPVCRRVIASERELWDGLRRYGDRLEHLAADSVETARLSLRRALRAAQRLGTDDLAALESRVSTVCATNAAPAFECPDRELDEVRHGVARLWARGERERARCLAACLAQLDRCEQQMRAALRALEEEPSLVLWRDACHALSAPGRGASAETLPAALETRPLVAVYKLCRLDSELPHALRALIQVLLDEQAAPDAHREARAAAGELCQREYERRSRSSRRSLFDPRTLDAARLRTRRLDLVAQQRFGNPGEWRRLAQARAGNDSEPA